MDRRLARSLVGLQADLERSTFASAVLGMWLQCSICGLTKECPWFQVPAVNSPLLLLSERLLVHYQELDG